MALMSTIVNDVLIELRFAAGQDVQVHLQQSIVANVSRLYRTLMKKHVWRDYHVVTELVISAATGRVTSDISGVLTKFSNIIAVYLEDDDSPLPVLPVTSNPARSRRVGIVASGGATVFTVWPKQARNIILISKFFSEDDFEMDDDVPFYRDVLALGAAYMLSLKAGVNRELTDSLLKQFEQLLDIHVMDEMQSFYPTNIHRGQFPLEWYERA